MAKVTCFQCSGSGFFFEARTREACCGNTINGECRSHCAIPEDYEEQVRCDVCGGIGNISELVLPSPDP